MMILNSENKILVGRRLDHPCGFWQMPQGGIDDSEKPEEAVWREMMEEIGTNNAKLHKISLQWINYEIPEDISVSVDKQNNIEIKGPNKQLVGQTAAEIRSFRGPEPYKGKGIKYADEYINRKEGKKK